MVLIQLTEKALETSPYNSIAYGVLVAVLIAACGALWLKLQSEQKEGRAQFEKVVEIMTKIALSFEEDKGLREDVKEVLLSIKYERDDSKKRAERLEHLEKMVDSIYKKVFGVKD